MPARHVEHALARARARGGGRWSAADSGRRRRCPGPAASRSDRTSLSGTSGRDPSGGRPSRNASRAQSMDHARQAPIASIAAPWGWPSRSAASRASRGAWDSGPASPASGARAGAGSSRASRSTSASSPRTSWRRRSARRCDPSRRCADRRRSSRCAPCSRRACPRADSRCRRRATRASRRTSGRAAARASSA